jgi:hypothetical protein
MSANNEDDGSTAASDDFLAYLQGADGEAPPACVYTCCISLWNDDSRDTGNGDKLMVMPSAK